MKKNLISLIFLGVFTFTITTVISREFRGTQIPNGINNKCANCHINPNGDGARNTFGKLIAQKFLAEFGSAGNVIS